MGLLDFFNTDEGRLGLGLLAAAGPRSDGMGFGGRVQEAFQGQDARKKQQAEAEWKTLQMENARAQMAQRQQEEARDQQMRELAQRFQRPAQQRLAPLAGDPAAGILPSAGRAAVPAGFDFEGYAGALAGFDPLKAMELQRSLQKDDAPVTLKPGEQMFSGKASGYKPLLSVPDKESLGPAAVQEYKFAKDQGYPGSFIDFQLAQKKAGASNVNVKTDVKMGEGVAAQVGPMVKDSKIQTGGAVKMYDAANRIEQAIASNGVSAGPLTTQIQTVKQLVQKVGGGNDDGIRQTRQVIKSLAQMSVEARKQLQGQGQVTESEAAAVAKADAGDINDLTIGELKDLVTLTKRAAHYTAKSHQEMLTGLDESGQTKNLSKFYQVPGIDTLLNHSPTMPQIGGDVHSRAAAILKGK
jgi:hypothetical protein